MHRTRILVVLEIEESSSGDADHVVDKILDSGIFQDAINDYDGDSPVRVKSATCMPAREGEGVR
jgi:hypothetical protein